MNQRLTWKKISETEIDAGYRKIIRRKFELPSGIIDDFHLCTARETEVLT
jgi:hypothetical protein